MAQSLAHRWGQIIGDVFEAFVHGVLMEVAERNGLYLDSEGPREARGRQRKVRWRDGFGNQHDLDYVLERGGSEDVIGTPVAFVESAWRRYTKHSKNKVQEIEAAVMPVALTFSRHQPFCGAVLAGEFTRTAIQQLESRGFTVLHVPYSSIMTAFNEVGIDASSTDGMGGTSERLFRDKIKRWRLLDQARSLPLLLEKLHSLHKQDVLAFKERLEATISRRVLSIRLAILRGHSVDCVDVQSAVDYLIREETSFQLREDGEQRARFEVQVRFNNGASIEAIFPRRAEAIAFLRSLE